MTTERTPTQEECMSAAIREYVRSWWDQQAIKEREDES